MIFECILKKLRKAIEVEGGVESTITGQGCTSPNAAFELRLIGLEIEAKINNSPPLKTTKNAIPNSHNRSKTKI